ncbi:hypothetical protein BDW59DRAFT_153792 [Aspergillus cavernicola]|uniref:Zn(2)-C6 fungal-type domain-containing protein n=1 Tax=Aspergillus cavernicola TaxID=176166 RepID=A0ABR4HJC8_9EURO
MDDPFLCAWTTQYTNSAMSISMSSPLETSHPRRKTSQRAHKTCDHERPCEQCTKCRKQQACLRGSAYEPRLGSRYRDQDSARESSTECINPILLNTESPSPGFENNAVTRLLRENTSTPFSCSKEAQDGSPGADMLSGHPPEDMFEDILAELLAFDVVRPQMSNVGGCNEYEIKQVQHGFSISSGWSSTFFPPGMEEGAERSTGRLR